MKKGKSKIQIRNSTAEFLIFTRQAGEDGIEVRVEDETVWLTQKLMAALFEVTVPTINEHLANLYSQEEIVKGSTIRNFRTVQKEGGRKSVVRNFRTTVADERQLSGNTGLFRAGCSSPTLTAISKKPWKATRKRRNKAETRAVSEKCT